MSNHIMVLDERPETQRVTENSLRQRLGFHVIPASNIEHASRWILSGRSPQPDMLVIDIHAPKAETLRFIRQVKSYKPQMPVLVLCPCGYEDQALLSIQAGANDFLTTPVIIERLHLSIVNAMRLIDMAHEISYLERRSAGEFSLAEMIGHSEAFQKIRTAAEKAAASSAPVWLDGELGTGKETLAHAIHGSSSHAGKPFVTVHCRRFSAVREYGGLHNNRMQSARPSFLNQLRAANGGTLYFDEISLLDPALQRYFIEVINNGRVTSVDGNYTVPINIRIICGNSVDIVGASQSSNFNHPLYRYLKGITLNIPSLRERKADIAPLAEYFIKRYSVTENKASSSILPEALQMLENHQWPGNVRQLANLMWRAAILCNGNKIDASNLRLMQQLEPVDYRARTVVQANEGATFFDTQGQIKKLRSIEEDAIRLALRFSGGCMTRAARNLGIGRSTLYRKIDEMGLTPAQTSRENQTTRPMMYVSPGEIS